MLLAVPGVVVASLITAALWQAIKPDWHFNACWLLGTIVSATDPVAVVALLKDLGADTALGTMIEGESLLNDGSAVVLFSFIMSWIRYSDVGFVEQVVPVTGNLWVELLLIIAQMLVAGVLFGGFAGLLVVNVLRRIYNDPTIEVALVLSSTYLVFWLAETVLKSSAVLAVVFMGIYLSKHAECISVDRRPNLGPSR